MFEFIAPQAQGIAAAIVASQTPEPDQYDTEIATRYPHLSAKVRSQLAAFDRKVATNGHDSVLEATVYPARLAARHPFAH